MNCDYMDIRCSDISCDLCEKIQMQAYNKAIDDFVETLVSAFDETNIKEYGFYPENLVRQVAKQLKEGD